MAHSTLLRGNRERLRRPYPIIARPNPRPVRAASPHPSRPHSCDPPVSIRCHQPLNRDIVGPSRRMMPLDRHLSRCSVIHRLPWTPPHSSTVPSLRFSLAPILIALRAAVTHPLQEATILLIGSCPPAPSPPDPAPCPDHRSRVTTNAVPPWGRDESPHQVTAPASLDMSCRDRRRYNTRTPRLARRASLRSIRKPLRMSSVAPSGHALVVGAESAIGSEPEGPGQVPGGWPTLQLSGRGSGGMRHEEADRRRSQFAPRRLQLHGEWRHPD